MMLSKLFRGPKMQATPELNEREIQTRLAEVETAINSGPADLVALLEEKESLERRLAAARIASEKRKVDEYQSRVRAEAAERRGRLNAAKDELADLVPRLEMALAGFDNISAEIQEKGLGFESSQMMEDTLGLPPDFGRKVLAAIRDAAPNYEWDWVHVGILGQAVKPEHPKKKTPLLREPVFKNSGPPMGYNGAWDLLRDRPFQEPVPAAPPLAVFNVGKTEE